MRKKIMIFLLSSMLLAGCAKETEEELVQPKDCGCGGEVEFTIPEDEPLEGAIYFGGEDTVGTTGEFNMKYVIYFSDTTGLRVGHYFYICNDELIPSELRDKLNLGGRQDSIYFSGYASKICDPDIITLNNATHNHIILTKLEKK